MKIYAILRKSDNGEAMPDGFSTTFLEEGVDEVEARLDLALALLDSLGYEVEYERPTTYFPEAELVTHFEKKGIRFEYIHGAV